MTSSNTGLAFASGDYSSSHQAALEQIDRKLLQVCKRCFIATNAMDKENDLQALEKFERYRIELISYIDLVKTVLYDRLRLTIDPQQYLELCSALEADSRKIYKRILVFSVHPGHVAVQRRKLFVRAMWRIDINLTNNHIRERDILYSLL